MPRMTQKVQPLVTIGIPTYNRADGYLGQTLESALSQTYPNVEIVVSDNCSTDHTESLVTGLADPRVRYFRQARNIPANDNFNFCLEQAKGDYFLLLHDDDMIDEDFVDVCMRAADYDTDMGLIRTGMRKIDAHGKVLEERPNLVGGLSADEFFLAWLGGKTPMHLCCSLFNTKRLKEIGGFNSKHQLFQDVIAEVQLAAKFGRVDIQDAKASFRTHAATRTHAHKVSAWCEDSLILLDIMCDLVPEGSRELVRRKGMRFFTRHNYVLAQQVRSPIDRLVAYLVVFRTFEYPVDFFVSKMLLPVRRAKSRMMEKVSSGGLFASNVRGSN